MSLPDRKIRSTRVLGMLFVLAGFGAIGAGWYGMIRQDQSVDRQFPYLISGGAAGIALLMFGVALLVIAQIRTERRRLSTALERSRPPARQVASGSAPAPEPEGSAFPGRYLKVFGLAVCAAGFASIAIGWNGSARLTVVDQQFPFLLSGGVLGVALVLFGVGVLMVAQIKMERQKLARSLQGVGVGGGRPRVAVHSPSAEIDPLDDGIVLAGPSTYHRADCALIKDRPGLEPTTVEEARAQGLTECRVCRPTRRLEAAKKNPRAAAKAEADTDGAAAADGADAGASGADTPGADVDAGSGAAESTAGEPAGTDGSRRGRGRRRTKSEAVASGGRDVA